jgi:hypothetical protein
VARRLSFLRRSQLSLRLRLRNSFTRLFAIGIGGGVGLSAVSGLMYFKRALCEPVLALVWRIFLSGSGRHGYRFRYDPDDYYLVVAIIAVMAISWTVAFAVEIIRKPSVDRTIDANLKARLTKHSHGPPLEPK